MSAQELLARMYKGEGIESNVQVIGWTSNECAGDCDCDCACGCAGGGNCEPIVQPD